MRADMPPLLARAYAVCVLCTATATAFLLTAVVSLPVPLYFPLARRWAMGTPADLERQLSMDYYGRSLFALLCGGACALVAHAILRRRPPPAPEAAPPEADPPASPPTLYLWTAYAGTAIALCAALFTYKLVTRDLTPEPLPTWYVPR